MHSHDVSGPAPEELPAPPTLAHGADDIFWVAHMHAALDEQGFFPGEEEMEAWVFEDQTMSALLSFQVGTSAVATSACDWASPMLPLMMWAILARRRGAWRKRACATRIPGGTCCALKQLHSVLQRHPSWYASCVGHSSSL